MKTLTFDSLTCLCAVCEGSDKVAYVLYPMDSLGSWMPQAVEKYNTSVVVITGMDWDNVFSPWPSPGQPPGSPDFKGEASSFLNLLNEKVIPGIETQVFPGKSVVRNLVGVSMSGLFALWQWMLCDTFENIASLSGSFWYPGFIEWMRARAIPHKSGKGYFLLGNQESRSGVKAFDPVGVNTAEIISLLRKAGIDVEFQSVPGNHFSDPIPRLDKAFAALF